MQGFQLGAASYKSSIGRHRFFSTGDLGKAYGDPVFGKTFSTQFIAQKGVDVLFQVAGAPATARSTRPAPPASWPSAWTWTSTSPTQPPTSAS
jgi:basic membrane lipoprotein Med (substrate-binding protein (PBP1-ABC) superfamily)